MSMLFDLPPSVTAAFDGGNILCDSVVQQEDTVVFNLRIRPERYTTTDGRSHFQWFYFRCCNVGNKACDFYITNAGESSYPPGWKNYRTFLSYDQESWQRCLATSYDEARGVLSWHQDFDSSQDTAWFAYFVPYTYEDHQKLIGRCCLSP